MNKSISVSRWLKAASKPHKPTQQQRIAKERLKSALEEHHAVVDVESLTMHQIERMCGSGKIKDWTEESPGFLAWLLDKDHQRHRIGALFDMGLDVLEDIIVSDYEAKILTAKDKLNAISLLSQLADKMPAKNKVVTFLDKNVGDMTEAEVDKQLAAAKKKLLESGKEN